MATGIAARLRNPTLRRALTVPVVGLGACALTATAPVWAPATIVVDLLDRRAGLPRLRMLTFATAWTALESVGVGVSAALWATGQAADRDAHYSLQRWWAARLVDALSATMNLQVDVDGLDQLRPGPIVVCSSHASIADSLLPAWLLGRVGMRPRYVLKDDLTIDPCLDIVGHRLPNHFVDRAPEDSAGELALLEQLADGMDDRDAAVIFPEGAVMTEARRTRAFAAIEAKDPQRAARLHALRRLGPVRAGGTAALLRGAPDADLVFVTHSGLEALDRVVASTSGIPLPEPAHVHITRVARAEIPDDDFAAWLDERWIELDGRLPAPG